MQFTLALPLASTGYATAMVVAFALLIAIPSIPLSGAIDAFNSVTGYSHTSKSPLLPRRYKPTVPLA